MPVVRGPRHTVCSANEILFKSIDWSLKFGLEVNVANTLKLGGAFFKNITTGETGASLTAKIGVGYTVSSVNPPGVRLGTPGVQPTHTVSAGPFQHNLSTGENSTSVSFGAAVGIGAEANFNAKKYWDLIGQCDVIVD
jgi:hypothetical protein